MCGIAGIYAFNEIGRWAMPQLRAATDALAHRGPDAARLWDEGRCGLGHRRLSIIDLSAAGHQPMTDPTGRYTLVFNGEIYNYRELRSQWLAEVPFQSASDTEVLLQLWARFGPACLEKLHGFFAFAVYDRDEDSLFIARDRLGIKPLVYYADEDKFLFASEINALLEFGLPRQVDWAAARMYFQLHYVPAPHSMLRGVGKLLPGHWLRVQGRQLTTQAWYTVPLAPPRPGQGLSYQAAQTELVRLMEQSVTERLVADVPLGTFLSGGIDSSVITGLARRHVPDLHTFSIGYTDEPFFDETRYANLVAKKFGTRHTVFSLSNHDLYQAVGPLLDGLGEPFADSSCLPVYILSQRTRGHVTVALSGDGADELFAGYNKYLGEYRARQGGLLNALVKAGLPLWEALPRSRNSALGNRVRQLYRLAQSLGKTPPERYWFLSSFMAEAALEQLFAPGLALDSGLLPSEAESEYLPDLLKQLLAQPYAHRRAAVLRPLQTTDFNEFLLADVQTLLPNDMLTKVDLMSMAHALEVRVPFLDHRVVNFAFSLPAEYKITGQMKKRLVQDAFRGLLPAELYRRPKHGFDVPLAKGFQTELRGWLEAAFDPAFIASQGVFNPSYLQNLKKTVLARGSYDQNHVWAIIVFQHWWKRLGLSR
ncbi:MAG: asparagine synthase (glutamine-hydrolyzing) [Bernardetiaceae bacterium]|jgi:asparagine synthase (glutamine-hydrolysing)|nr:asparagine synthase (glutamine-hydrolyzing) [Bernardetiaceae bacterium]